MNEQIFDKASEYIDAIATNLGVAAEHVYTLMTRQMFVEGIVHSSFSVACIIIFALASIKLFKYLKNNHEELSRYANDIWCYAGLVVLVFVIVIFGFELSEGLMKIFNPEYYVIKDIMDMFSSN